MNFIPVNEPVLNGNEKKYLCECIDTGWISSEGPFVTKFEDKMRKIIGRKYGISVSNGTAALEVAAQAIGLKAGDEVIMPTFTIISCAMAVTKLGAIPILVDSNLDDWNMCVEQIEEKITENTKAILAVHLYGLPVKMDKIIQLSKKYNLKIIEDAAEMHGQTYNGQPCGSFGDISVFSFYPNKLVTAGEGGMILTDDEELADRCRSLRNLCFRNDIRYVHNEISDNYRFTNLQAAVGLAQLERFDEFVQRKRQIGKYYTAGFQDLEGVNLPVSKTQYAENIYWVYGIVLKKEINCSGLDLVRLLSKEGIGCRTFFWCMHEQPVYLEQGLFHHESYPNAEYLARKGFYIPSGLAITEKQMDIVIEKVKKVIRNLV